MRSSPLVPAACVSALLAGWSGIASASQGPYAEFRLGDATVTPGQTDLTIPISLIIHGAPVEPAEVTQWYICLRLYLFGEVERIDLESAWDWDSFVTAGMDCYEPGRICFHASAAPDRPFPSGEIVGYLKLCVFPEGILPLDHRVFDLGPDDDECERWPNDTLVHVKDVGWVNATLKGGNLTFVGEPVDSTACPSPPEPPAPLAAFRLGDVTAAPGETGVRMPLYLSANDEVESWAAEVRYDPTAIAGVSVENACDWEIRFFGPEQFPTPGTVAVRAYASAQSNEKLATNGGIAAHLKFCVRPEAAPGEHPVSFVADPAHWRDIWTQCSTRDERTYEPALTDGKLTIAGDPVPGGDCPADPEFVDDFESRWPWIRLGKATAAPGETEVRLPIVIDAGPATVERWNVRIRYDASWTGSVTVENTCGWDMSVFGVETYWDPGVVEVLAGATRASRRAMDANGGIAAYLNLCVLEDAQQIQFPLFKCDYVPVRSLFVNSDIATEGATAPALFAEGELTVAGDPIAGGSCSPDPPPRPLPQYLFRLDGRSARRGEEVVVPLVAQANYAIGGLQFSIQYDPAVLEPTGIEKAYTRPDGKPYYAEFYWLPVTKGPWGYDWLLDEGLVAGRAEFAVQHGFDPDYPPADTENVLVNLRFRVKPDAPAGETSLAFVDSASVRAWDGDSWIIFRFPNSLNGWQIDPEVQVSPMQIGTQLKIVGSIGEFIRGDANGDGTTDISDAVAILGDLFLGNSKVPCQQAGDANDDGVLDISDAVYLLAFLFLGGKAIEPPVEECGVDPIGHDLPCGSFPRCQ